MSVHDEIEAAEKLEGLLAALQDAADSDELDRAMHRRFLREAGLAHEVPMPSGYYPVVIFPGYVPVVFDGQAGGTEIEAKKWYFVSMPSRKLTWEVLMEQHGHHFTVAHGFDNREKE